MERQQEDAETLRSAYSDQRTSDEVLVARSSRVAARSYFQEHYHNLFQLNTYQPH